MSRSSLPVLLAAGLLLLLLLARFFLLLRPWQYFRPKITGSATVLSRRVEYRHGWNYYITFSLGGMELELQASERAWHTLPEGTQTQLVWRDAQLLEYET